MAGWSGFKVGDYVIADSAEFDYFPETWKVVHLDFNAMGREVVHVVDIETMNNLEPRRTVFYPRELSLEDGTQPDQEV